MFVASLSAGVAKRCRGVERGLVYVPLVEADGPTLHDVEVFELAPLAYDSGPDRGLRCGDDEAEEGLGHPDEEGHGHEDDDLLVGREADERRRGCGG